jgi:RNA polymerase sigma-70 factor (ECF subfamily)
MVALLSSVPSASSTAADTRAARNAASREAAVHDAGLVRRFNTGDQSAFEEIVTRYRAKMHLVALGLLRNHADAEEIAQDTFIRAHRSLANFRGESSLAAWLHCIALNLSRNRYWYFFRRRRHVTQSLESAVSVENQTTYADLIASNSPGPVRETTSREFSSLVTECMAALTVHQREILLLRNVRQHSYREIARMLGITLGTVKSRVARARETLRDLLAQSYADGGKGEDDVSLFRWFEPGEPAGLLVASGN